jgi:cytochrome P450
MTTRGSAATCPVFNPFSEDLIISPHQAFEKLRGHEGLYWCSMLGAWVVTEKAAADHVLKDASFIGVDVAGILEELARRAGRDYRHLVRFLRAVLFFKDGPAHEAERRTIAKVVNSVKLSSLEHTVLSIAKELIGDFATRGHVDAVRDFAEPLPQRIMAYILGIPAEDVAELNELLSEVTLIFDAASLATYDRLEAKAQAALQLVMTRMAASLASGADNGLCKLHAEAAGEGLERLENAAATAIFVLRVGAETTVGLLGSMFRHLVDEPGIFVAAKGGAVPGDRIINELLRLESNVQRAARVATSDQVIAGTTVRKGDRMLVLIGAANTDPACFHRANQIDAGLPT